MNLHQPIETYFDADRRRDREALTAAFAADATVTDEGRTYEGRQAIGAWWAETKARYQPVIEPLEASASDGGSVVRARVSGDFPGSPAVLRFAFRLADEKITALEIGA